MASMKMIVFQVEQGQCVFVRTPNDYGILIDCGRGGSGPTSSPAEWLDENEAQSLTRFHGHTLAAMIVTHSHDGHVADMETVMDRLSPAVTVGDAIPAERSKDLNSLGDIGVHVRKFALSRQEAAALGGSEREIVNNSSIVTVITYNSEEGYTWKVVVAGDNETKGWEALVARAEFADEIADADFFVTSSHGQESGFCADLFKAMGKPIANISSTRGQDKDADKRYRKLAQGVKFPDGKRTDLETHGDGNITVEMHDDGRYDVYLFTPGVPVAGAVS